MPFDFNFEVPQSNQDWDSHHVSTYSPPPPWSEELLYTESHHDMTSIGQGSYGQQNFADIYSPRGQYPLVPNVYQPSQKQSLEDTLQSFLQIQRTLCPQSNHEEVVCDEPCPICSSHNHFVTECPQACEFPEFVQKYVNTTQGCLNPSSDNLYSYTQDNEWETHSNSSWTQEPWVDDSNTFSPPSQFIAPFEQPNQHYYPPLPSENPNFEDSMLQTLQEYEATIQTFASTCKSIAELGIQTDKLVHTDHGHEEQESLTQAQQEPIWEVETISERHNGELWETESELNSFEIEHISEDHKNLTQELITPLNELIQCVDEVELFSQTKSFIDVEQIDILGVENFNWVVDPYFVQLINKLKTTLIENGLVVEYKCLRHKKNKKYSKYLIIWDGQIQFLSKDLSWDLLGIIIQLDGGVLNIEKSPDNLLLVSLYIV
ncbi:uncharacterized protein LOC130758739 [Actinidia eriantha]|uniref:uncharacterized protein LOC130758739 n=1 Tax=Actinidia eriantha TaxID=165200 RepID=UPI00258883AE|nr:uncharacterized protein LOC130758739 [Actinidia eriantha]